MTVFFDADDVAGIAGEVAAGNTDLLVFLEFLLIVDLAPCGFIGCEQPQEMNRAF